MCLTEIFLTLETAISATFNVRQNVVPPWRVWQAHSGSKSSMNLEVNHLWTSMQNNLEKLHLVCILIFISILHSFTQEQEKKSITTLMEGWGNPILVSKICNGKPRRGLQILDMQMGIPRPPLNMVLDSINLSWGWSAVRNPSLDIQDWDVTVARPPSTEIIIRGQTTGNYISRTHAIYLMILCNKLGTNTDICIQNSKSVIQHWLKFLNTKFNFNWIENKSTYCNRSADERLVFHGFVEDLEEPHLLFLCLGVVLHVDSLPDPSRHVHHRVLRLPCYQRLVITKQPTGKVSFPWSDWSIERATFLKLYLMLFSNDLIVLMNGQHFLNVTQFLQGL